MARHVLSYIELRERTEALTAEQEAKSILLALAGHQCVLCGKTLLRATGYTCCGFSYCPICGMAVWGCGHRVAKKYRTVTLFDHNGGTLQLLPHPDFKQTPKWYRVAEQAGQLPLPFDKEPSLVAPPTIDKKAWKLELSALHRQLLETVLRPDIRTAHANASGHYRYLFFSFDPYSARERALSAVTLLRSPTQ